MASQEDPDLLLASFQKAIDQTQYQGNLQCLMVSYPLYKMKMKDAVQREGH